MGRILTQTLVFKRGREYQFPINHGNIADDAPKKNAKKTAQYQRVVS